MANRKQPGRPRELVAPQMLTVTLEQVQIDYLFRRANEMSRSVSEVVRQIVARHMLDQAPVDDAAGT